MAWWNTEVVARPVLFFENYSKPISESISLYMRSNSPQIMEDEIYSWSLVNAVITERSPLYIDCAGFTDPLNTL